MKRFYKKPEIELYVITPNNALTISELEDGMDWGNADEDAGNV